MKENQIRKLVNELRDIAIEYHGTQQLCERIARTVRDAWHHELEKPNQPVSQTYELPQTQLEQVADLYEMQFDDGRTCAFHTDGAKAAQWLLACDGNKVQEYVRIERYQEAVIGNSPVIPDGYALVPVEPTDEMIDAAMNCEDVLFNSDESFCVQFGNIYEAMLAAAPQQEVK